VAPREVLSPGSTKPVVEEFPDAAPATLRGAWILPPLAVITRMATGATSITVSNFFSCPA
jgi:hypothetical protein